MTILTGNRLKHPFKLIIKPSAERNCSPIKKSQDQPIHSQLEKVNNNNNLPLFNTIILINKHWIIFIQHGFADTAYQGQDRIRQRDCDGANFIGSVPCPIASGAGYRSIQVWSQTFPNVGLGQGQVSIYSASSDAEQI